jgi:hypothetical protein
LTWKAPAGKYTSARKEKKLTQMELAKAPDHFQAVSIGKGPVDARHFQAGRAGGNSGNHGRRNTRQSSTLINKIIAEEVDTYLEQNELSVQEICRRPLHF